MAYILNANCNSCGYQKKGLELGGYWSNFVTYCGMPALNTESYDIETLNYFEKSKYNNNYCFYNEKDMYHNEDKSKFLIQGEERISCNGNRCPKCNNYEMEFDFVGLLD